MRRSARSRASFSETPSLGLESGLSALELGAVGKKVNVDYVKLIDRLLSWDEQEELPLHEDAAIDAALVRWQNL